MNAAERAKRWSSGEGYNRYITSELNSFRKEAWKEQIGKLLDGDDLRILDVGCGPGFFSCILSEMGHKVTGIDSSEGMLSFARANAEKLNVNPTYFIMDINSIDFPDDTFDIVISRNVTWTLEHPGEVYAEFKRLLKPGGKLIIYDANWNMHFFDDVLYKKVKQREEDHFKKYGTKEIISNGDMEYLATAPLTSTMRPQWDIKTLKALDMDVDVEEDVGRNVYEEWEKELYAESPLFCVCAVKGERRELTEDMHTYWQERSKTYIFDPENFKQTQDTVRPFLNEGIKRVIDIGTGPGFMAAAFADMGMEVTATDLCSEMIAKAKKNFESLGLKGEFVVTEADELPFDDDSFDMLVCRNVTWALPNPEKTLKTWKRVLRHGGLLFYTDGNYYNYFFDDEIRKLKERCSKEYEKDHEPEKLPGTPGFNLCDETAKELPLSPLKRPEEWDDIALPKEGFLILRKEVRYPQNLVPFGEGWGYTEQFEIIAQNYKPPM